jgi:hypothetical protein
MQTDPATLSVSITSAFISLSSLLSSILIFRASFRASVRPVLVFEYEQNEGWHLKNIGQGPALNVIVSQHRDSEWFHPVRVPPISKERSIALTWCLHDNEFGLGALYEDANGRKYTATCSNDLSSTKSGWRFGPWPERAIGKLWANGNVVMPSADLR